MKDVDHAGDRRMVQQAVREPFDPRFPNPHTC